VKKKEVSNGAQAATQPGPMVINLPKLNIQRLRIPLIGDSSLICHRWSEKARKEMLDKQMKKAKSAREAKNPEQDFMDTLYEHPEGGYGFPAVAFKSAEMLCDSNVAGVLDE